MYESKVSPERLANECGVSKRMVENWLFYNEDPEYTQQKIICTVLDIDPEVFVRALLDTTIIREKTKNVSENISNNVDCNSGSRRR